MKLAYMSPVLIVGTLAFNFFRAEAKGACAGIPVYPGAGTLVEVDREDIALKGDAYYDNQDEEFVLARGPHQMGALKFGSILKKLAIERFDWGMEMGFRVRKDPNQFGYGFIMTYGGSETCVQNRVYEDIPNMFADARGQNQFCKGVTLAVWADKEYDAFFILVDGILEQKIKDEKADIFDKEHCLVMTVDQPTEHEAGSVTFVVDGREIGTSVRFVSQNLEGDGDEIFAYGATSKAGDGLVQMADVEIKTRRDLNNANLFNDADHVVQTGVSSMVWALMIIAMMGVVAKVAFRYGKSLNYR